MASWFTDMDGETIIWIVITSAMIIGTNLGLWYWDRHLNRFHNNQEARR